MADAKASNKRDVSWMRGACTSDSSRWFHRPFTMRWRGQYWCVATDGCAALLVRRRGPKGRFGGTRKQREKWAREALNRPARRAGDIKLISLRKWLGRPPTRWAMDHGQPPDPGRILSTTVNKRLAALFLPAELSGEVVRVTAAGEWDAVHFRGRDWLAVVMPMKAKPVGRRCPVRELTK
jgi:hypothetical protein